MVWLKATYRTPVVLNPSKLAAWSKYWSKFNDGIQMEVLLDHGLEAALP
jgi:hypothetical protein